MSQLTATDFNVVLVVLRVLFGLTFAAHGFAKRFRGGRIPGTAGWFDGMGMRPGRVHAEVASITEILAGLALVIGLFTPLASAAVIGVMLVAGYTVHRGRFFIVDNGWEYTFIMAVVAAVIAGLGPGEWSMDHALGIAERFSGLTGAAIAIVLGVMAGVGQILLFYRPPESSA